MNAAVSRWLRAAEEAHGAHTCTPEIRIGTVATVPLISARTQARHWRESRQSFNADLLLLLHTTTGLKLTMVDAFHLDAALWFIKITLSLFFHDKKLL